MLERLILILEARGTSNTQGRWPQGEELSYIHPDVKSKTQKRNKFLSRCAACVEVEDRQRDDTSSHVLISTIHGAL